MIGKIGDDIGPISFLNIYQNMIIIGGSYKRLDIINLINLEKLRTPIRLPNES
jgi:hypothetical protein